jgi:flagellar biogenesis protein FliO
MVTGILVVSFLIIFGMLGLLIWVLKKAYTRRSE